MKVICNRSDECSKIDCYHIRPHDTDDDCGQYDCKHASRTVECTDDETYEVKPMPIRFELVDEEG